MAEEKKEKRKLIDKLLNKYRIVLLNDSTFQEVGFMRLTRLNVIAVGGFFAIVIIAIVWSLIAYTPIREIIPGYPDMEMRNNIIQNKIRLDSKTLLPEKDRKTLLSPLLNLQLPGIQMLADQIPIPSSKMI